MDEMQRGQVTPNQRNPVIERVMGIVDLLKTTVEGVYFDNQLEKLGISPSDPQVMQKLQQRMSQLEQSDVAEGFTVSADGRQKLSDTQNRQMLMQNTQRLLQHYAKRNEPRQNTQQQIDFFKR